MMKSLKVINGFILVFILVVFFFSPAVCGAEETIVNEDIHKAAGTLEIPRTTVVNGNVTLNLGELTVLGVVNGNVNSNMGQINIGGDVNGNVEANMGQVNITGNVDGDVRARMGEVIIDGSVSGNIYADLGAVRVGGAVGGDLDSGFGELRINGVVAGDVFSKGGTVKIDGIVEGDVILEQGLVELGPEAIVSGRINIGRGTVRKAATAFAENIEISEEVTVGELAQSEPVQDPEGYSFDGVDSNFIEDTADRIVEAVERSVRDLTVMPHNLRSRDWRLSPFTGLGGNVARGVINILILFALTALTYTLFPKQVRAAGAAITEKTGPVVGWGVLAAVLAIPLMIVLAITLIGIPLIIVEIIVLAAAALLGYSGLAELVGRRVVNVATDRTVSPLGAIGLGVLIIGLVSMIPILGSLVTLVVYVLAVGAALATRFGIVREVETVQLPAGGQPPIEKDQ